MRSEIAASELSTAVGSETESALGFTGYRDYIAAGGQHNTQIQNIDRSHLLYSEKDIERGGREGISNQ